MWSESDVEKSRFFGLTALTIHIPKGKPEENAGKPQGNVREPKEHLGKPEETLGKPRIQTVRVSPLISKDNFSYVFEKNTGSIPCLSFAVICSQLSQIHSELDETYPGRIL